MALIVEDGTVVTGAESYITVTAADTYFSNRGDATWAALTATKKEEALRKATDYMTQAYRPRWKGYRKDGTQLLDWPRSFVYLEPFVHGIVGTYPFLVSDVIVPTEVKNACAELAVKASAAALAPDLERAVASETIGPISTTYDAASIEHTRYRAIDLMLRPYLTGSSSSASLVRT